MNVLMIILALDVITGIHDIASWEFDSIDES